MAWKDLPEELRQRINTKEGLVELLRQYGGQRPMARALRIDHTIIGDRMSKFEIPTSGVSKGAVTFDNLKPEPGPSDLDAYLEAALAMQEAAAALDTKQTEIDLSVPEDKPIAIAFWGDWHLGGKGVDYRGHEEDAQIIESTDGLYWVGMGDYKDNFNAVPHATGCNEQVFPPGTQDMLVLRYMRRCRERSLAVIRGCHDHWDKKFGDKDFVVSCCEEMKPCTNLWHGGLIHLGVGRQVYDVRARHKFPGESSLNTTNTQRRQIECDGEADIYARAHRHYPDCQTVPKAGRVVVFGRSGSRKHLDEFGEQIGGLRGKAGILTVVLHSREKKMVAFADVRDALPYLKAVRG